MRMLRRLIEVMVIGAVALLLALSWLSLGPSSAQDPRVLRQQIKKELDDFKAESESRFNQLIQRIENRLPQPPGPTPPPVENGPSETGLSVLDLLGTWVPVGTSERVTINEALASPLRRRVSDTLVGDGAIEAYAYPSALDPKPNFRITLNIPGRPVCTYYITKLTDRMYWEPGGSSPNPEKCRRKTEFRRYIRPIHTRRANRCWPCHPCWRYRPCWYHRCW